MSRRQKKDWSARQLFRNGLLDQNPIFGQLLGMCSALAVSTSVINGFTMGLCVTFVLTLSNLFISLLRRFILPQIRIAAYIVIVAGFVTVVDLLLKAYFPSLAASLGLFIPLIVVNCVILARAESFASKQPVAPSLLDGVSMGLGYTVAMVVISSVRELLGSGSFCGIRILGDWFSPAMLLISPVGGFLVLGGLMAGVSWLKNKRKKEE